MLRILSVLRAYFARTFAYLIPPGPPDIGLANATPVLKMLLSRLPRFSGRSENVNGCTDVMLIELIAKVHRIMNSKCARAIIWIYCLFFKTFIYSWNLIYILSISEVSISNIDNGCIKIRVALKC